MSITVLLAAIALYVPLPAQYTVDQTPCPSVPASWMVDCTEPGGEVHFTDPLDSTMDLKQDLAHELGHVWDQEHFTDADRARYAAMIGHPRRWTFSDPNEVNDIKTWDIPAGERFADAYALCAMSPRYRFLMRTRYGGYFGLYGERISRRALAVTCWLLDHPPH